MKFRKETVSKILKAAEEGDMYFSIYGPGWGGFYSLNAESATEFILNREQFLAEFHGMTKQEWIDFEALYKLSWENQDPEGHNSLCTLEKFKKLRGIE
jgi:hypothetical protein